ncbi:MAG: tetratricopeptide repeat protein, partial [Acidobacteriota bacterium]|nr:tetratricopeptide repeat protein [Acidobacteriota bacterium]MDQ5871668.1 tetratricopeptide repeat protein [Acidobacteriota bacterium]
MDHDQEARLRDLKKRVEREPRSRFFVPLAEEYRKAGRLPEAIKALEDGLESHPGYVAARVALARAFLETGRIDDSVAAFSKVLADDPSNLVAAKALGDIHLSRGEPMEALKRYLRFRAVSGDRRLDEVIAKLRAESPPSPDATAAPAIAPPALASPGLPPPAFEPAMRIELPEAPAEPPRLV